LSDNTRLEYYGDSRLFHSLLTDGYTTIKFGEGPLLDGQAVIGFFVVQHPDGRLTCTGTKKDYNHEAPHRLSTRETFPSAVDEKFVALIETNKIVFEPEQDLSRFLSSISSQRPSFSG
jgi:hypothetical protein